MTNYNNTDKIIREKYDSFDPVFDAESMWADVSPLVEKKRRRGFFFWALSGAVMIVLGLVGFNLFFQDDIVPAISIVANEGITHTNELVLDSDVKVLPLKSNEKIDFSNKNDGNIESVIRDEKSERNSAIRHSPISINVTGGDSNIRNENANFYLANQQKYKPLLGEDTKSINHLFANISSTFNSSIDGLEASRFLIIRSELPFINIASLEYSMDREVKLNSEMVEIPNTKPLLKNQWRIGINGGYYIHSRSFENVGDDISDNYSSRSMEEKAKDGFDLGVKLEYFLSDNFVVLGGLRYSQSYVQRKADFTYTDRITIDDHVVAIINTEQGPIEVTEDITYDGIINHKADNYIIAKRVGLITGLQYRIGADRWTTHVDLGIELPVWSNYSGVITNDRRPYDLSEDTDAINTSSPQIFGGIGIEYSLSTSTALQATIGGFMPLKNEHVEFYAIEKKSTLLGLNLGVHFRL